MPNRISRRERRRRLYYLLAVCERIQRVAGPDVDLPDTFDVELDTFVAWVEQREPVPAWIPQLATQAYRVPPPPRSRIPALFWSLVAVVLAGIGAALLLRFVLR